MVNQEQHFIQFITLSFFKEFLYLISRTQHFLYLIASSYSFPFADSFQFLDL